ncbi:DUF775 domain protein [Thermoascus aurantiacus ATCC 26904]
MFGVIIPGRPCLTDIVTVDAQPNGQATKFAFSFPANPSFAHVVVFFLPGTVLPPDTAAAIYIQLPDSKPGPNGPEFRFIGAIANEKPSAIFKVRSGETQKLPERTEAEEQDEMVDEGASNITGTGTLNGTVTLGISIEPAQSVAQQLAALQAQGNPTSPSTALVRVSPQQQQQQKQITTKVLAQRIIGNAFNFLASFASSDPNKEEVVPLKSFRDWWAKFERRVEMDPGFLERDDANI